MIIGRLLIESTTYLDSRDGTNRLKKLLVIGVTGLAGSRTVRLAEKQGYEAWGTYNARSFSAPAAVKLDITDRDATLGLVQKLRPDVIIDTAALHNVDYCETHREEADKVNVEGTRALADAARSTGSRLIFLSTDFVFDGEGAPYTETDLPNPLDYYAKTKVDAENIVAQLPNYGIARSSVIYGWNPVELTGLPSSSGKTVNFAMYCLDKFRQGETVGVVNDQYSSPTLADNLSEALLKLAEYSGSGIFHTAGRSCLTRYDFAVKIATTFGYSSDFVQPVATRDLNQMALRPRNSCLSVENAEKELGVRFLTADEGLQAMKDQLEREPMILKA